MTKNKAVVAWFWRKENGQEIAMLICSIKPHVCKDGNVKLTHLKRDNKGKWPKYFAQFFCEEEFVRFFPHIHEKLTKEPKRFPIRIGR